MKSDFNEALAAVVSERRYQEMRKVRDSGQESHSVGEYLLYMQDYLNEAIHVAARTWGPDAPAKTLEIVRKVTALGFACMEDNGSPKREGT